MSCAPNGPTPVLNPGYCSRRLKYALDFGVLGDIGDVVQASVYSAAGSSGMRLVQAVFRPPCAPHSWRTIPWEDGGPALHRCTPPLASHEGRIGGLPRAQDDNSPSEALASMDEVITAWMKNPIPLDIGNTASSVEWQTAGDASMDMSPSWQLSWLRERLKLSDDAVAKISRSFPAVNGIKVEENLEPKLDWFQRRLHLDDPALARMITLCPRVLGLGVESNLEPKILWLQETLEIDLDLVGKMVIRCPSILALSVEDNLKKKLVYFREELKLDSSSITRMLVKQPTVLTRSLEECIRPRVAWLRYRLGLDARGVRKVVTGTGVLFHMKIEDTLEMKLRWLENDLGLEESAVKIVRMFPQLLTYNVESMKGKFSWLQGRLGLSLPNMNLLIRRCPEIFCYSVESNMEPKLNFLQSELGLDMPSLGKLVMRYPRLLGASLDDNLRNKIPWLERELGLSKEEVVAVVVRAPDLLRLDTEENLGPTLRFLHEELGASRKDVAETAQSNAKFLAASLEKRWKPRVAAIRAMGVTPNFNYHWKSIVNHTPQRFEEWLDDL